MLRLRPAARDDLDAAARWYEAQEPGLGRQFLAEVRLVFQRIRSNPPSASKYDAFLSKSLGGLMEQLND